MKETYRHTKGRAIMSLYFDTINSVYNYNERVRLDNEYKEKKKKWEECSKNYNDADYEAKEEKAFQEMRRAERKCFAAQFPKTRNKWFSGVVDNFVKSGKGYDELRHRYEFYISEKQFDCFSQFCREDSDSWATNCCYCRCSDYLITLKRLCGRRYAMRIERL